MSGRGVAGFDRERLRDARERAGLSQRDVAEQLLQAIRTAWPPTDVARAARHLDNVRLQVQDYEAGTVTPRPEKLHQLAEILGIDAWELLSPDSPFNLEALRIRLGLRQADVAARGLGAGRVHYSKVERGEASLADGQREQLARILAVSRAEIDMAMAGGHTIASMTAQSAPRASLRRAQNSAARIPADAPRQGEPVRR